MTGGERPAGKSGQYALPRAARITASEEIRTLFRRGKRRKTRHLDVFVSASPVPRSRIGLVVPKPKKKTSPDGRRVRAAAVQRNRLKRRLREIARTELLPSLQCNADVLVRARPEAYGASFESLRDELTAIQEWMCSSAH